MSNNTQPLLGSLGLCRKAGRLLHGHDRVLEAVLSGKVALVLLAQDASERTARHLRDACEGLVPCRTADGCRTGRAYSQARRRVRRHR